MKKLLANTKKLLIGLVFLILLVSAIIAAVYFFYQYRKEKQKNPEHEIGNYTKLISEFYQLPTDEEPSLATVTDKEKLSGQTFFQQAENGDKVLIYVKAKKAILFRPSTNKIIDVAPVQSNQTTPQPTSAPETTVSPTEVPLAPLTVTLYNGTSTVGLTNKAETTISDSKAFKVEKKQAAASTAYTDTIIVDVSGSNAEEASELAKLFSGKVDQLPAGETKPATDLLVIIGSSFSQ